MDDSRQFLVLAEPVPLDWPTQGDEWLARFGRALDQHSNIRMTGHRYDENSKPFIEVYTASVDVSSTTYTLLLGSHDDGIVLVTPADADEEIPSDVVTAWLDAAKKATESLGKRDIQHEWSAIIGPVPTHIGESRVGVDSEGLAIPGTIGPLSLSSTGRPIIELASNPEIPSFGAGNGHGSVPIIARGASPGYSWDNAAMSAARDLNRACGLLSAAWGVCMVIRASPAPLERGLRRVPERPVGFSDDFVPETRDNPVVDREIPPWADRAWREMSTRLRVADAVAAFHEGFKVESAHPSLALVSFIASIEAISLLLFHEERCPECSQYRNVGAKFDATLRFVLPDDRVRDLGNIYSTRSKTVHRGKLHGFEPIVGALRMGIWSQNDERDFYWNRVYPMREASRALLALALKGELPPRRQFSREEADDASAP